MISKDGVLGIAFLFQTGFGIVGNVILFVSYAHIFTVSVKQRPRCLIITHLSLVHMLLVCTVGIPEEAAALGLRNFMGHVTCKTNAFIHRTSRGLSICLMSLLNTFQAITISPASSYLGKFKSRNLLYILCSFVCLWLLNLLISSILITSATALKNMTPSRGSFYPCFLLPMDDLIRWLFLMTSALRDACFLSSMCWMSGYMMICLYRHHKHIQHLHRSSLHLKMSPEMSATKKIIILTLCFISVYGFDMVVSFHLGYFSKYEPVLLNAKKFIGGSFALLSPVVLLSNDNQLHRFWASFIEKMRKQ